MNNIINTPVSEEERELMLECIKIAMASGNLTIGGLIDHLLTHGYGRVEKVQHDTAKDICCQLRDANWDSGYLFDGVDDAARDSKNREIWAYTEDSIVKTIDEIEKEYNIQY